MQTEQIPLDETGGFSAFFIDYIQQKPELQPFYSKFPLIENFQSSIRNRNFDIEKRHILADAFQQQYDGFNASKNVLDNIEKIRSEKTFTVTTGHQLNIFTGPLYFIYKIITAVNACKSLKQNYPENDFIPVYWMASEDHDFDEINHFYFEGGKIDWHTEQTGAVGKFDPKGLLEIADQLPDKANLFKEAYSLETLAQAGRSYVNCLFGDEGVLIMDADDATLKKLFAPVVENDIFEHSANKLVTTDSAEIEKLGYKTQVHCREINFFYHDGKVRERIEKDGDTYKVVGTGIHFSKTEIQNLIRDHPERFSPNVILRPLYQETILPNLAYVGGPSEVAYWLQLTSVFSKFNVPFPLLMPRNFAVIIPRNEAVKWKKTELPNRDLFLEQDQAFSKWVKSHTTKNLSYSKELAQFNLIYDKMKNKASLVDPTLQQHIETLKTGARQRIEKAEKKLLRAEKRNHEEKKIQITAVKEALFPNGTFQERHDNFLNFYLNDSHFIQTLLDTFDAFDYSMYLLFE